MQQRIFPCLLLLASACSNSGLTKYDPPPEDADPLTLDQCPQLCAEAITAGCSLITCDVDVARDYTGDLDILVFHLDGASDGGGGCELVVDCPVPSDCALSYQQCLADAGEVSYCNDQYELCTRAADCSTSLTTCNDAVGDQLEWCNMNTPDANCQDAYVEGLDACQCIYDDCLTDETLDCTTTAARIAPPIQTGPTAFTVSRGYVDQQLARLAALSVETLVWPTPSADRKSWRGLRVDSIDLGEPLYRLGLRSGDVVRTVNRQPVIAALADPPKLLALRNASTITLGVERGGVVRQFRYALTP